MHPGTSPGPGGDLHSESTMRFLLLSACVTSAVIGAARALPAADDKAEPAKLPASYAQGVLRVEGMI